MEIEDCLHLALHLDNLTACRKAWNQLYRIEIHIPVLNHVYLIFHYETY